MPSIIWKDSPTVHNIWTCVFFVVGIFMFLIYKYRLPQNDKIVLELTVWLGLILMGLLVLWLEPKRIIIPALFGLSFLAGYIFALLLVDYTRPAVYTSVAPFIGMLLSVWAVWIHARARFTSIKKNGICLGNMYYGCEKDSILKQKPGNRSWRESHQQPGAQRIIKSHTL